MKYAIFIILMSLAGTSVKAQMTLEGCKAMARDNYPVIKQYDLVEQSRDFTVSNAAKAWLPQFSFNAKASYQSDAVKLPVSIPDIDFKGLSKDQYDFNLYVSQSVYDGGGISSAKAVARRQSDVDYESVNVAMYDVYDRVEQLYFGILVLDEQTRQTLVLQDDLGISLRSVEGMMAGGIANETDVDAVKVEQMQTEQTLTGLEAARKAYVKMLSTFIGEELSDGVQFVKPADTEILSIENRRPELSLYNAQTLLLDEKEKAIDTDLRPRLSVFAQGGYGDPALNIFKTGFQWYYKVGATLTWNFGSLYTRSNDKRKIELERRKVASNRETFLLNTEMQSEQQGGEIAKLRKQIAQDDEIITLRENIRSKAEAKVENGTETVNEMLRDVNAVSQARMQKSLHEVQLLQEIYKLKTLNNN